MSDELVELTLPLMGEGITEATLVKWLKKPGDAVEKDEAVVEVSTDKVDTELTSPASGFLIRTYAGENQQVAVHSILAYISKDKAAKAPESVANPQPASENRPASNQPNSSSPSGSSGAPVNAHQPGGPQIITSGEVRSSPLVRKMARDMNINLGAVAGRGLHGRITKTDMLNFVDKLRLDAGAVNTSPILRNLATTHVNGQELLEGVPVRREPMTKMRRLIAEHMVQSVATSPHVTTTFEIDMHRLVALRDKSNESFQKKEGFKLTFTHLIAHATVLAIKENPIVNVSVDGTDILYKDDINLGIAVAIESGLIVPVVKQANDMPLRELARAINDIVVRARSKKLSPDDVQGGTFSITNPGLFGSLNSQPIINQPQVAIESVGAIIKRPVVINDDIVIRPLVQIGLTFDHRVVDGEGGAKYLSDLKRIIETYDEGEL